MKPTIGGRAFVIASAIGMGLVGAACSSGDDTTRDDAGTIVEEGELSAFSVQVGDCLGGEAIGEVSSFDGVPCDQPHDSEVFLTFDVADGDFPSDAVLNERAQTDCLAAFEPFVGLSFEESIYGISWLVPTVQTWDQADDREIVCLINNFDGTKKSGTAKDTAV